MPFRAVHQILMVVMTPHASIKDCIVAGIAPGELPLGKRLTIEELSARAFFPTVAGATMDRGLREQGAALPRRRPGKSAAHTHALGRMGETWPFTGDQIATFAARTCPPVALFQRDHSPVAEAGRRRGGGPDAITVGSAASKPPRTCRTILDGWLSYARAYWLNHSMVRVHACSAAALL